MPRVKEQIAALPVRLNKNGKPRVLLVTSRETRRWVMPKGWPMDGKKPWRAAEIEAMEEAGVVGKISKLPVGEYGYKKRRYRNTSRSVNCNVTLYPMRVEKVLKNWPERNERQRKWFSLKQAAALVKEPALTEILREIRKNPELAYPKKATKKAG